LFPARDEDHIRLRSETRRFGELEFAGSKLAINQNYSLALPCGECQRKLSEWRQRSCCASSHHRWAGAWTM